MKCTQVLDRCEAGVARFRCLTGNQIKLVAVVCMFVDHISKILLTSVAMNIWNPMLRSGGISPEVCEYAFALADAVAYPIGAVAFPLFCYMFVEGYQHTSSRKKYVLRLAAFALISEIPFDLAFFSGFSKVAGTWPLYWHYQNVFFTFLLGMCALTLIDVLGKIPQKVLSVSLQCAAVAGVCALSEFVVHADYEGYGVFLIVLFYVLRKYRVLQALGPLAATFIIYNRYPGSLLAAMLLILLYNGKRGRRDLKYFFYVFYPAHIYLLHLADMAIAHLWA